MRTKICLLLLVVALLVSGCAITKETKREVESVEGIVVSVDYDPPYNQPMMVGKSITFIHHSANYDVTVEYDGLFATFDDETLYHAFENNIGGTIKLNLVTIYYSNGDVRQRLERSG